MPTNPDTSPYIERYKAFLEKVNAALPAGTGDAERKALLLQALDEQLGRDAEQISQETQADLQGLFDEVLVAQHEAGVHGDHQEKLEAIRQSI